ncbi:hypothetical protein TorRG33x02_243850 [Trema orientale]|uniref:Uncharacterized protein n=1 Tax=Trema orientale TaxID=63057 RepID=A0A2P5DRR6_TREOI|nr:hypothetical protein TorRG33x02_243850 [Trema orientale]
MCKTKLNGGLGFKSVVHFNQALVACEVDLAHFFKGRYFPQSEILLARPGHTPSLIWRSILWGRYLLLKGLQKKKIGSGSDICCFDHPWIPNKTCF